MKVIVILDKEEFNELKSKYNNQEMIECKHLYDYYKSAGIFEELEIDPKIIERVDAYFARVFGSEMRAMIEFLDSILANENNTETYMIRKEVSDVIRHVETYLKMSPYY